MMAWDVAGPSSRRVVSGPPTVAIKTEDAQVALMDVDADFNMPETRSQRKRQGEFPLCSTNTTDGVKFDD
jgi:hypothetical protein